jgi:hypothetical protein
MTRISITALIIGSTVFDGVRRHRGGGGHCNQVPTVRTEAGVYAAVNLKGNMQHLTPLQQEILRTINKAEEMKWITVSEHLNKEALVAVFLDVFKEMSLKRALEIFMPKELW